MNKQPVLDDHVDDHVDEEIRLCLSEASPKCFFMFAGAGSGKTRSLVSALNFLRESRGKEYQRLGKRIAVITYTNAASDEIQNRIQHDPIFHVSTIHSFLWMLISGFQRDIKTWLKLHLQEKISDVDSKIAKARQTTLAKYEEEKSDYEKSLAQIDQIQQFQYNPNGNNASKESLSHSQVIKMATDFIREKKTMQRLLINQFPILFIDESQDTKKELVDAIMEVHNSFKDSWIIGMFGDTMQRIYMDGHPNLPKLISDDWETPEKKMNHRSCKRVVALANKIRSQVDSCKQQARSDAGEGFIRVFITRPGVDRKKFEIAVAKQMAQITEDSLWLEKDKCKSLILEHKMAARRFGFENIYTPLSDSKRFDTELKDGSISELHFLANVIQPLISAKQTDDSFAIAKIMRSHALPFTDKKSDFTIETIKKCHFAVDEIFELFCQYKDPSCLEILKKTYESGLFNISERVKNILIDDYDEDEKISALRKALQAPFSELQHYSDYVSEKTEFATHQGVKGLEFDRVMIILDDYSANMKTFSYEKLFEIVPKSSTDIKNENEGKDTTIARTARLFYVACTRAKKSLAIVLYTEEPENAKEFFIRNKWFADNEIIIQ